MNDSDKRIQTAVEYYSKGNIPQAEIYCRHLISLHGNQPDPLVMLGMIALSAGANDFAKDYFQQALACHPEHQVARKYLELAMARHSQKYTADHEQFILIKAWGYGFWSDMDHVMGQLLLAEITGRTPVIEWGDNSLFLATSESNAFLQFFEPVSDYTAEDLAGRNYSFFPPKWSEANLHCNNISKWTGEYSRMAAIFMLNRKEDVLVSDFQTMVRDILPWISQDHYLFGKDIESVYRYLFKKYIKLKPGLQASIDQFHAENMQERKILAVHVRGSDKEIEIPDLEKLNKTYHSRITSFFQQYPDSSLFLLTDSDAVLNSYLKKYDNIIHTDSERTSTKEGIHMQASAHPENRAIEVIIDTYLAASCDYFIGNGWSNVSQSVLHLKEWDQAHYFIYGPNLLFEPNFYLHEW